MVTSNKIDTFYVNGPASEVAKKLATLYDPHGYSHKNEPKDGNGISELFSIHYLPKAMGEEARKKLLLRFSDFDAGIVGIVYNNEDTPDVSIVNSVPSHEQSSKINLENAIALGLDTHQ